VSSLPRVWLLIGSRRGDNNQVLALGEALGLPFETRTIFYKRTARLRMKLWPRSIGHLTPAAQRWLGPPWPDLVIGVGQRTVSVARWIRQQSGGRTRLVRVGHPRAPNDLFDLVITTRQYPVPPGENVVTLPLAMNRFRAPPVATLDEQRWLDALPRPHLLLSLGGTAPMWRLDLKALGESTGKLVRRAESLGGTLLVVGSPRTPAEAWTAVGESVGGSPHVAVIEDSSVRYAVALNDADEQFVTADSVSMISEAVITGKPVGLIPVEPDSRGRRRLRADPSETRVRDPRRFWAEVEQRGLVGTVEEPVRGHVDDPVETAVAAVRARLGSLFE
jgi:mitochondrial fission protein ELM1